VLDKAEAKGHSISWGQRSFAVRAHLPNDKFASFAYGWLSAEFQFYFGQGGFPLPEEQSKTLRKELVDFGVFTKTRPKTLTADVDRGTVGKLPAVFDFILDKVDKILSESSELNSSQLEHGSV
jgi:hypothetical protein